MTHPTRHSTTVALRGPVTHAEGIATRHDDGTVVGHLTIYLDHGSMSISADTPEALRSIAGALHEAADALTVELHGTTDKTVAVPA